MNTHYRLLSQLDSCFEMLVNSLETLSDLLDEAQPACWMLGCQTEEDSRRSLHHSLQDLWYLDGQDGRATRSYPGLVACDPVIWDQLGSVNYCKVTFSRAIEAIRRESPDELPEARERLAARHRALHAHLTDEGLARLHLKQSWRQIPGCETALEQIRFSWYTSGRSIRRISRKEAEYRLLQMNTEAPHIQIQLKKLAALPLDEPLAQVQTQAPLMRANLFFKDQLPGLPDRKAINAAMPLFVLSPDGKLPPFNIPSSEPPEKRQRAVRSDNRLDDTPFLPSIRVYRYSQ
ncbi:hypothetical protein [Marinospirillum alkaliphilum]|uniref:DNA replication terminus site binding protein n=1 Tax=Marinospirillum alkaliphilum DSM 21637 TaxID=1122209 RepID=A0A1K1U6C5_9GAMM|nr:hypothetical protein [Marinospirillum alkaliphilum]SFX08346.1 DNA replication terminus site binding protein [Marinospirillum alkaliphilum DSM 21637]